MAAGPPLPKPGTEYGPCLDEACGHIDCETTRRMAASGCLHCGDPIDYDSRWYDLRGSRYDDGTTDEQLVHASCHTEVIAYERAIDREVEEG